MTVNLATYGGLRADVGYNGQLADLKSNDGVVNRINESATPIDYGVAVRDGVAVQSCAVVSTDADRVIGISVRHVTSVGSVQGVVNYPQFACVPVLESGRILITPYEAVTKGAPVFARVSDGRLGVTSTAVTHVSVPNARWEEAGTSAGVAPVFIDLAPA